MSDTRMALMEAIARRRLISARYNGEIVSLAPHLLFERHGDLYVNALNLGKNWRSDEDRRLGQFKIAGLGEAQVLEEGFDPLPGYEAATPRPDDTLILGV